MGLGSSFPLSYDLYYANDMPGDVMSVKGGLYYQFGVRVNIPGKAYSAGIQYAMAEHHKEVGDLCEHSTQMNLQAFFDYNFRQGRTVNPFVGVGAGYADVQYPLVSRYHRKNSEGVHYLPFIDKRYGALCLTPRAGVELLGHLRITVAATYVDQYASYAVVAVSGVFGGGRKK